jgi:NitT/TauT family transport system permease protein
MGGAVDAAPWLDMRTFRHSLILVVVLLVLWQVLYWVVGEIAFRSPWQTLGYTTVLLATASFWPNLIETGRAFALALVLSVVFGLGIGFALGLSRLANAVFEPMLVASYAIPKITLYPLLLLMFGLGMSGKVAFGVIHGVIPIALFTTNAARHIRPVFLKTGRILGFGSVEMAWHVLLPAAMPEIFSGLRIGFALTLIGVILGEMFASQRGIGYLLMNAIGLHNVDLIMALTFLLTMFAVIASTVLLSVNRRMQHSR